MLVLVCQTQLGGYGRTPAFFDRQSVAYSRAPPFQRANRTLRVKHRKDQRFLRVLFWREPPQRAALPGSNQRAGRIAESEYAAGNMAREKHGGLVLIGALKLLKALGLVALGVGVLSLQHRDPAETVRHWIEFLRVDARAQWVERLLAKVAGIDHHTIRRLGLGTLVYAALFGTEGVGLVMGKTWAEYMTTGVTISFLPLEGYEMIMHPSVIKGLVTAANVAIVLYLVHEIRRRRAQRPLVETNPSRE